MYFTSFVPSTILVLITGSFVLIASGKNPMREKNDVLFGSKTPIFLVSSDTEFEKYKYSPDDEDEDELRLRNEKIQNNKNISEEIQRIKRQNLNPMYQYFPAGGYYQCPSANDYPQYYYVDENNQYQVYDPNTYYIIPQDPNGGFQNPQGNNFYPNGGFPNTQGNNFYPYPVDDDDESDEDIPIDSKTVYPQVLVVVDYDTFKYHKKNPKSVVQYVAALYTGVDLRFRQVTSPKIRFNIAGIIIATKRNALPYAVYGMQIDTPTLTMVGQYFLNPPSFYRKIKFDVVNVMLYRESMTSTLGSENLGIAFVMGACKVKFGIGVALSRTGGGFENIHISAHELAHSFGASHDGEMAVGTQEYCERQDGYIMMPRAVMTEQSMLFSDCSIRSMQTYLRSPQARCLRNKPDVGTPFKNILPGKLASRDDQCQSAMGSGEWYAHGSTRDCGPMTCVTGYYQWINAMTIPAEGTSCGDGFMCLKGRCVLDK